MNNAAYASPARPEARILCADERLRRLFEIELAHLGIEVAGDTTRETARQAPDGAEKAPSVCLVIADLDEVAPTDAVAIARALGCPLLAFAREAGDLPGVGECLRRPFALPALEGALRRLLAGATTTAAPLGVGHPLWSAAPGAPRATPTPLPTLALAPEGDAALVEGRRIPLTPTEAALLGCLLEHRAASPGEPVPRAALAALIDGGGNSLDVYICHLRRKLEKPVGRRMIGTVRGRGYVLE